MRAGAAEREGGENKTDGIFGLDDLAGDIRLLGRRGHVVVPSQFCGPTARGAIYGMRCWMVDDLELQIARVDGDALR